MPMLFIPICSVAALTAIYAGFKEVDVMKDCWLGPDTASVTSAKCDDRGYSIDMIYSMLIDVHMYRTTGKI